jgi:two-component system CitB family sensor kinase
VRVRTEAGRAVIEVHDNGPGVPVERRADLFTSLATTKPDGNGLGLFSVKACANGLGGQVEVGDSPLGGALFRIRLPLATSRN